MAMKGTAGLGMLPPADEAGMGTKYQTLGSPSQKGFGMKKGPIIRFFRQSS